MFSHPSSPDMLRMLEDEVKLAMMLDKQVKVVFSFDKNWLAENTPCL